MPLIQRKLSLAYFVLTLLGLWLLQAVVFAPQSETLTYRDFKTLLQAGKIVDVADWGHGGPIALLRLLDLTLADLF